MTTIPVGYKQTEIGIIPENWEVKFLQTGTQLLSGHHVLAQNCNTEGKGVPYITGPADFPDGVIRHSKFTEKPTTICHPNDILVTVKGSGAGTIIISDAAYCISRQLMAIRVADWDTTYVYFSLLLDNSVFEGATAGLIPGLSRSDILNRQIAIPPTLEEQRAIAEVLSDIDSQLTTLDALVAKKRDLKQGVMQELLTGQRRLPGVGDSMGYRQTDAGIFPEDWKLEPFIKISSMNGRIGWQGLKQAEFTMQTDDPFLITGMNFKDGKIRWEEVYHIPNSRYEEASEIQLKPNDILMTKDGTIGKLLYVEHIPYPGKASLNSHLLVFRPLNNAYDPKFMFYQLHTTYFQRHIDTEKSGTTFFGFTQEAMGKYLAILPPLEEQKAIAIILTDMDEEITMLDQQREKVAALKQGMMQDLLTGKKRLL